jgi:hypothetical protein
MNGLGRFTVCALVSAVLFMTGPGGGGAAADTINMRPISDWLGTGHFPTATWTTSFDQLPDGYVAFTFPGLLAGGVEGTTALDGMIVERRLASGRVEVTVMVVGKNAPLTIYGMQDWLDWIAAGRPALRPSAVLGAGTNGSLDFRSTLVFVVNEMGAPLPFQIAPEDFLKSTIEGNGSGTFTSYAANFGYTPGADGQVHIRQTGLLHVAAHANGAALEDEFPSELINLRETGR